MTATRNDGRRVELPAYETGACMPGIVHLGLGAFARAHLAHYTETLLTERGGDWRIIGVSLRSGSVADQLVPQDGLYTLVEQGVGPVGAEQRCRVLSAIADVLVAPDSPRAVIDAMALGTVRVVSLTVTEKGYCHDSASGELLIAHPDIAWDLAHLDQPRTAVGFVVAGLARRFARGLPAFTPLSLDNLPNNGALLKRLCVTYAGAIDPGLAARIEQVPFPSTMVDRIVPATTDTDRRALTERLGYVDYAMVKAEPFTQWVIEDRFVAGRPDWNLGGALFVDAVLPFETMKLRLLNGSHSAIAYLGALAGYEFVHEVVADPVLKRFISRLMANELAPTLIAPPGISLAEYQNDLLERFANPALAHRTLQIAADGSQKLPPRILAPLRVRISGGQSSARLMLVIAAWLRFVERQLADIELSGVRADEALNDPLAEELAALMARKPKTIVERVQANLSLSSVFGADLAVNEELVEGIAYWFRKLKSGVASALLEVDSP